MLACCLIGALSLSFVPLALAHAATYAIQDCYIGNNFYDGWIWETLDDPTHGRTNYVDQETAKRDNLSFASSSKFVMRSDNLKVVPPGARGRDSVRIISKASYSESVMVLDIAHMPEGCGTWPAFWTLSAEGPWPEGGEIDIIEGVNKNTNNLASLHTKPNCTMTSERRQSGTTVSQNCDTSVNYNQGCGTSFNKPWSYGSGFNARGGGWYAMERNKTSGVAVWFWSRSDPSVPSDISSGSSNVGPTTNWGTPDAIFPTDACDHDCHFDAHSIVFDLTFCGDWAGSAYPTSGCGGTNCTDYVDNNPKAFLSAYWEINSLRVYAPAGTP